MPAYRFRIIFVADPHAFWRDVVVGADCDLTEFQRAINDTIGLDQSEYWFFGVGMEFWDSDMKFEGPEGYNDHPDVAHSNETVYNAAEMTIGDVVSAGNLAEGDRLCYLYDYRANWRFVVGLQEIRDDLPSDTSPTVDHDVGPAVEYPLRKGTLEITPAINTTGLTRRFGTDEGEVVAVDGLNVTVGQGEVFGFVGTNGAGKSTTINMLLGFLEPTSGDATVLGFDATTESRKIRARIGLLPEGYEVYPNLTAREHLLSAIETKQSDDDPDEIIQRVGLDPDDARRPAGEYSKGMQQRLALGVALVGDPQLLILDEPSSGLDPKGVQLLREIVREEARRGATVFFSSHILSEVETVCDRVGILRDGELVTVDTIENLRRELGTEAQITAEVNPVPEVRSIRNVDGVSEVTVNDGVVRIACSKAQAKMIALRRLDEVTTVEDITIEEPSLESLFEEYTGGASDDVSRQPTALRAGETT